MGPSHREWGETMLERVERILSVGRFKDFVADFSVQFGDVTLVYGDNGTGKTTLAAVFDSLRENSAAYVKRRATLGGGTPQVEVHVDGTIYVFDGDAWDSELPHDCLEVYYSDFVARNVYCGNGVVTDNYRGLCEFALGRKAVGNVRALTEADGKARNAKTELNRVEGSIQALLESDYTVDEFIGLPKDNDIDTRIDAAQQRLRQAKQMEALKQKPVPSALPVPEMKLELLREVLGRTLDDIPEGVDEVVSRHITEHLDERGQAWLEYGAAHLTDDLVCPFCGQGTSGVALVEAIAAYFSDEYKAHTKTLASEVHDLRSVFGGTVFGAVQTEAEKQLGIAQSWETIAKLDEAEYRKAVGDAAQCWAVASEKVNALLDKKLEDITCAVTGDEAAEVAELVAHTAASLKAASEMLVEITSKAKAYVLELEGVGETKAAREVARLRDEKKRYEKKAIGLIEEREAKKKERQDALSRKDTLKQSIDEHAGSVVSKYQDSINEHLARFGCDVRIEEVSAVFPGGRASMKYALKLRDHAIALDFLENEPCFDTALSESDKALLGLSFFLARLEAHEDLSGMTVVFDDPVNSLGRSRRQHILTANS